MKRTLILAVLLLCGGLFTARPATAADDGQIAVGGVNLFSITAPAEGKTIKQRADEVTDRLPDILAMTNIAASDIHIAKTGNTKAKITVKNKFFITVTPEDGKPNKRTAMQQAEVWAKKMREVLPTINVKPNPNGR